MSALISFYEQLTIAALTDQRARETIAAAGVQLPNNLQHHLELLAKLGQAEITADQKNLPLKTRELLLKKQNVIVPYSPSMLALQLSEIERRERIFQAAEKIFKSELDPDEAPDFLSARRLQPVESGNLEDLSEHFLKEIKADISAGRAIFSIPDFPMLSRMIGGFNAKRISMFTGETGLGKTNFSINLALSAATACPVAYVNMEMSYRDMVARFTVINNATYENFYLGYFEPGVEAHALKRPFPINLTSGRQLSFEQIKAHLTLQKRSQDIKLAIVDYDQKIEMQYNKNTPEWKELQNILIGFEELAKELDVHIMVLAQVNRDGNISGSFRSMFPAHTVLAFRQDETHGTVIEAKKNRHGKKNQAVKVLYSEHSSRVTEIEVITLSKDQKKEVPKKIRNFASE